MNFKKRILYAALILLLLFIANIFISTGFFRTIENKFDGTILKEIAISGAEDITISHIDSFAIMSATARKKLPKTEEEFGNLYFLDLKDANYKPINLTANFKKHFAPHGISMFKTDSTYTIVAVNHTANKHSLEVFKLNGQTLTHTKTLEDQNIHSPNDIVLLDENRFYFTNDHKYTEGVGQLAEDYLGLAISNVIYFDGENYTEVADGIAYANGINFDVKRNLLYVASPRKFLVKVFQKNHNGSLTFIEDIDCNTGVDNIEFDTDGNLWIGAHPNLLHFAAYAKGSEEFSPSEIIKISYKSKGDYTLEQVYMGDGSKMSGSTVAATFGDLIFTGNVMDTKFLILEQSSN